MTQGWNQFHISTVLMWLVQDMYSFRVVVPPPPLQSRLDMMLCTCCSVGMSVGMLVFLSDFRFDTLIHFNVQIRRQKFNF